jgi:hypothetical protein
MPQTPYLGSTFADAARNQRRYVSWLRRFVVGLSPRRPELSPRLLRMELWWRKCFWDRIFPEWIYFQSTSGVPCQYHSRDIPFSSIYLSPTLSNLSNWQRNWIITLKNKSQKQLKLSGFRIKCGEIIVVLHGDRHRSSVLQDLIWHTHTHTHTHTHVSGMQKTGAPGHLDYYNFVWWILSMELANEIIVTMRILTCLQLFLDN